MTLSYYTKVSSVMSPKQAHYEATWLMFSGQDQIKSLVIMVSRSFSCMTINTPPTRTASLHVAPPHVRCCWWSSSTSVPHESLSASTHQVGLHLPEAERQPHGDPQQGRRDREVGCCGDLVVFLSGCGLIGCGDVFVRGGGAEAAVCRKTSWRRTASRSACHSQQQPVNSELFKEARGQRGGAKTEGAVNGITLVFFLCQESVASINLNESAASSQTTLYIFATVRLMGEKLELQLPSG